MSGYNYMTKCHDGGAAAAGGGAAGAAGGGGGGGGGHDDRMDTGNEKSGNHADDYGYDNEIYIYIY